MTSEPFKNLNAGFIQSTVHHGNMASSDKESKSAHRLNLLRDYIPDAHVLISMKQVHGQNIHIVRPEERSENIPLHEVTIPETDGLITSEKGVVLLALGADCPLLLCYDPVTHAIGVAHSGWRGFRAGILTNLIKTMSKQFSSSIDNLHLFISASAGPCCYQVKSDVRNEFQDFPDHFFPKQPSGSFTMNIKAMIAHQFIANGGRPNHVQISKDCTICNPDYFSYRRQGQTAGRHGLFAWLK